MNYDDLAKLSGKELLQMVNEAIKDDLIRRIKKMTANLQDVRIDELAQIENFVSKHLKREPFTIGDLAQILAEKDEKIE